MTLDVADQDHLRLQHELLAQRRRSDRLLALLRLMVVLWKVFGFSLSGLRFPDPASRLRLLAAIAAKSHDNLDFSARIIATCDSSKLGLP